MSYAYIGMLVHFVSHLFSSRPPLSLTCSNWEMCADMLASFEETLEPAKFRMKYWGVASYLQTGSKLWNIYT